MKTVYSNNAEVFHLWANQVQKRAKCGNVFFEGPSCYSYGLHYELGRLIEYNGHTVALINNRGYSVTTSRHISLATQASQHLNMLKTTGPIDDVFGALLETQDQLIDDFMSILNKRIFYSNDFDSLWQVESINNFNKICENLRHEDLIIDVGCFKEIINDHIQACTIKTRDNYNNKNTNQIETSGVSATQLS